MTSWQLASYYIQEKEGNDMVMSCSKSECVCVINFRLYNSFMFVLVSIKNFKFSELLVKINNNSSMKDKLRSVDKKAIFRFLSVTYGTVERQYLPILLIPSCGAYVPGPGTAPLIMMFSGSRNNEKKCVSINNTKRLLYSYRLISKALRNAL